jgi:hypothetical protein
VHWNIWFLAYLDYFSAGTNEWYSLKQSERVGGRWAAGLLFLSARTVKTGARRKAAWRIRWRPEYPVFLVKNRLSAARHGSSIGTESRSN